MYLVLYFLFVFFTVNSIDDTEPKTIIFYGDSITAGYGIGTELAFPNLIETKLVNNGYNVEVVNAGLSGETSAGGLTRIDWMLNRNFDVFVLELGANDGLRGLPIDETYKNLQLIIDKVTEKLPHTKIVLTGMMVPPNMGTEYAQAFMRIYPDLAKDNNAQLIPFLLKDVAGIAELNQADGIHPNIQGHKIIAENLYPFFQNLL